MARFSELSILFPTGSFYPAQTGGPDNSVYWLAKALRQQGAQVKVVSTERGLSTSIPRNQWLEEDFATIIYTPNSIHYLPLNLIWRAFRNLKNADVLHLTMIFYPASFILAVLNQIFYKKKVIWSIRGDLDPHMMKRSSWKKRPIVFLIRQWLKNKVTFHATCKAETQYAKAELGQDIKIVELTNYMDLPNKLEVEKEKYFLFLGRIDSKKAIENLIEALDQSKEFRASGFHLKIAGDHQTPYGKQLIQLVDKLNLQGRVEFVGHASGIKKQKLLAAAYFLIMPSHTENFGIVVAEALAQGTPAVASIHTPWEILEQEGAGFWVDNQIDSLADCLDHILQLTDRAYKKIQSKTRALAVKEFDVKANIARWWAVYKDLLINNAALEHEHRI